MNVKEAVAAAKAYVADLFSNEPIQHIGLEEVEFDADHRIWSITIGFTRAWLPAFPPALTYSTKNRDYKIVRISDANGQVLSIKNRELVE
jgi:hypothetical protein